MKKNLPFRTWFYFRLGWSTYFAFLFAAINTLTVTYYLAIEKYPVLSEIFPTFGQYVLSIGIIGIPILICIGYTHYKKSPAYKSEADVVMESNPHTRRMLLNSETMLGMTLQLLNLIAKISNDEKLSDVEKKSILKLQKDLAEHMTKRSIHPSKLPTIFDNNRE